MRDSETNRALAIEFIRRMKECRGIDESLITADFQWWTPGAGYSDAKTMNSLIATLDPVMPDMPDMTILGTTAEGDRVAVEATGKCLLANGKHYDNTYHFLIVLEHGRVRMVKEYLDTQIAHDAFAGDSRQPSG